MTRAEQMRLYREQLRKEGRCTRCGEPADKKPNGEYYSQCLSCRDEVKKYGEEFRAKYPDYNRQYWAENKDNINQRRREVYAEGKTKAS